MELHYAERRLNVRKSIALLVMFGAFLMAHENRGERFILQRFRTNNRIRSPRLTASGQHDNVDKGSRQNRSVTSGKGLALRVGHRGPCSDVRAEQKLLDAFWWIVDSRMARIAGQGTPFGAFPVQ